MTALALTTQSAANPPSPGSSQETSKAGTADFAGAGNAERVNGGSPLVADIVTRAFDGIGERRIPRPAEAENPRPQGDTWGERSSVAEMVLRQPVPRLPPASALNRRPATFSALQEWEGYVVAVTDTHMIANLVNLTAGSTRATEQAEFPLEELNDDDLNRLRLGSLFRWAIGYHRTPSGTKMRVSQIVFRELPQWTARELGDARKEAAAMGEFLRSELAQNDSTSAGS